MSALVLRSGLRRHAVSSVLLQGLALGLTLLTGVILARVLGPSEYGMWAIGFAAATSLGTLAALGLPGLLVRRVAEHQAHRHWDALRSVLSRALKLSATSSVAIAAGAICIVAAWPGALGGGTAVFAVAVASLPLTTLTNAWGAGLRGLGHGVLAQSAPTVLRPLVLLAGVCMAYVLLSRHIDAVLAMAMNFIGALVALAATVVMFRRLRPAALSGASDKLEVPGLWRESIPFMLVGVMGVVGARVDLFLVGALLDAEAAGLYEVASRGADLVLLPLTATTAVIGPEYAKRFALRDDRGLQRLVTQSSRGLVLLSAPIAIVLIVLADPLVGLVFGNAFSGSAGALALLAGGTLAMLLMGPVHVLLGMTGRSGISAWGAFGGVALGSLASLALIPHFGIEGAAIGRSAGQIAAAAGLSWFAVRALGVRTWALPGRSSTAPPATRPTSPPTTPPKTPPGTTTR